MPTQENVLRLLIADPSLNDAEMLISVLRNAGHAVRASQVEDEEDLNDALNGHQHDLLLCSVEMGEALPLERACELVKQTGKDVPILAATHADSAEQRRQAMAVGALDLVSKNDLQHLQLVIAREVRNLNNRRRLRRLEAALRETEKRCYTLLDSSRDAIAYVHEGMHIYANQAYLERFGFESLEDIEGMPLLDMAASADQGRLKDFLRAYQKGEHHDDTELELAMISDGGKEFPVLMNFSEASIEGEPCTQILLRDKSDSHALEAQLDTLSKQDLLTGLFNRQYFMEQLEQRFGAALENGESGGLLYVQLDGLDSVRQSLGITSVDLIVGDTANIVRSELGEEGIAARFADDAFALLVAKDGVHESIAIAEAIRQRIEDHIAESEGRSVTTTCSIGIAALCETSGGPQAAVNAAVQAAEDARRKGGNQVHLHTPAEEQTQASQNHLKPRLEEALRSDKFFLVFQPVASLQGDATEHYEVRVRLADDSGMLMPADFVPQAEQLGMMPALDRWICQHAIKALAARLKAKHDTALFVKLSGATLTDTEFLAFLREQLQTFAVEGQRVIFQVNEPVAVTQLTQAKEIFRGLRALQCRFALDHFGSGLNPFQLVKHLPADFLKLDATLTSTLGHDEESQTAVQQLITSAHGGGRKVIAGYLEDASSLAYLWQYGTDYVQGYFLAEPSTQMDYDFSGMVI